MSSSFDQLEQQVMAELRKMYSETVIDHAMNPRNAGQIANADGFARITGPCGDTMEIWLKAQDGRIQEATFWTDGCGTTIAAGSMITELVKGKSVAEARRITQQDVLDALGGLPDDSIHCALLAANTLTEATNDYLTCTREPWRKAYRGH